MPLPQIAARIFDTPLLIAPGKLDVLLHVIGPRLGLDFQNLARSDGAESEFKERGEVKITSRIAVVPVVGTLANRVSLMDAMSGMTGYETLASEIDRLAADPGVDAILLEVDSFGGEAAGCFDLADRIHAAREVKPVWGVANQHAMSAGYALLSQCEKVYVPQSGEVGSIGVVITHMDMRDAAEKAGVRVTHIYAGAHKVDTSPFAALSEEASERLAGDVEQLYEQFLGVVARGGRVDVDQVRETEALTYIGERAKEAGLADEVGTRKDALSALTEHVKEQKRMNEIETQHAVLLAENSSLKVRIETFEQAEVSRLAQEDSAYLESLRQRSVDANSPIDAARLANVQGHLDAGRRDVARELGDAYLELSLSNKAGPTKTVMVAAPGPKSEHQAGIVRGRLHNERASLEKGMRSGAIGVSSLDAAKHRINEIDAQLHDAKTVVGGR